MSAVSRARLIIAVCLMGATMTVVRAVHEPVAAPEGAIAIPYTLASWSGTDTPMPDPEAEATLGADVTVNRTYVAGDGGEAGLYVAYYNQQRPGVSIHSPLHCLPGTGWDVVSNSAVPIDLPGGTSGAVRRLVAQKSSSRVLVLYWYSIQGRMVAGELASRMQLLANRVRHGRNDAALIRIVVPVVGSDEAAEARGLAFVRALAPHLPT
jgi:EpsI family protein